MIVTVLPKPMEAQESTPTAFYAIAPEGSVSFGTTPGEALDSLLQENGAQQGAGNPSPLLFILRNGQGDRFFTDAQNARLQTLRAQQKMVPFRHRNPKNWTICCKPKFARAVNAPHF